MAPERFRGEGDARADIYALGLTLYELLTLRPAFDSSDRLKLIEQIKTEEPPRPRSIDARIPRDLETIVLKAIEKDPKARYPSAEAMAEDLRRFLADEPIRARQVSAAERYWRWARRNPVIAILGGVLTAVLVLVTIGSLLAAGRFARLAEDDAAIVERSAEEASSPGEAESLPDEADQAREHGGDGPSGGPGRDLPRHAQRGQSPAGRASRPAGVTRPWAISPGSPSCRRRAATSVELRTRGRGLPRRARRRRGGPSRRLSRQRLALDFSLDSRVLATATVNGDLNLWDVARRQHSWQVVDPAGQVPARAWPTAGDPNIHVRFLPDGSLARTTWRHRVEFLDSSGLPSTRPQIDGGKAQAVGLDIDRRGHWLAVGWNDGRIELRDAATGALGRLIQGDPRSFAPSPDGRWLAFAARESAALIQPTDGDGPPITLERQRGGITSLAFSPDGTALGVASRDHTATLWDLARREELVTLRGHKEQVTDLAFSPDGNWVATTSLDYTARIWDARNGQTLAVLPGTGINHSVAFSPDAHSLAVSTQAQSSGTAVVSLYQIQGRRERRLLAGHRNGTQCLAFHPRSARLASGSDDHDVIVWDAESARPLLRWTADNVYVAALAFSPDGSLLATGAGRDGRVPFPDVKLWDAENGSPRRVLSGHRMGVQAIAFDPTGRRLATGDTGGVLIIWDVATGASSAARPWGRRGSGRSHSSTKAAASSPRSPTARSSSMTWKGKIRPDGSPRRGGYADSSSIGLETA